jgi:hypothetical protein
MRWRSLEEEGGGERALLALRPPGVCDGRRGEVDVVGRTLGVWRLEITRAIGWFLCVCASETMVARPLCFWRRRRRRRRAAAPSSPMAPPSAFQARAPPDTTATHTLRLTTRDTRTRTSCLCTHTHARHATPRSDAGETTPPHTPSFSLPFRRARREPPNTPAQSRADHRAIAHAFVSLFRSGACGAPLCATTPSSERPPPPPPPPPFRGWSPRAPPSATPSWTRPPSWTAARAAAPPRRDRRGAARARAFFQKARILLRARA